MSLDPALPTMGGPEIQAALLAEQPHLATWLLAGHGLLPDQLERIDAWLPPLATPWADEWETAHALALV